MNFLCDDVLGVVFEYYPYYNCRYHSKTIFNAAIKNYEAEKKTADDIYTNVVLFSRMRGHDALKILKEDVGNRNESALIAFARVHPRVAGNALEQYRSISKTTNGKVIYEIIKAASHSLIPFNIVTYINKYSDRHYARKIVELIGIPKMLEIIIEKDSYIRPFNKSKIFKTIVEIIDGGGEKSLTHKNIIDILLKNRQLISYVIYLSYIIDRPNDHGDSIDEFVILNVIRDFRVDDRRRQCFFENINFFRFLLDNYGLKWCIQMRERMPMPNGMNLISLIDGPDLLSEDVKIMSYAEDDPYIGRKRVITYMADMSGKYGSKYIDEAYLIRSEMHNLILSRDELATRKVYNHILQSTPTNGHHLQIGYDYESNVSMTYMDMIKKVLKKYIDLPIPNPGSHVLLKYVKQSVHDAYMEYHYPGPAPMITLAIVAEMSDSPSVIRNLYYYGLKNNKMEHSEKLLDICKKKNVSLDGLINKAVNSTRDGMIKSSKEIIDRILMWGKYGRFHK